MGISFEHAPPVNIGKRHGSTDTGSAAASRPGAAVRRTTAGGASACGRGDARRIAQREAITQC
eukprot:scaffold260281_cov31-Tisochrysis_lutea.AAC.2